MKILVAHNTYRLAGGEDSVVASEMELLRSNGNEVEAFTRDNREIDESNVLRLAAETVWSRRSANGLRERIREWGPDVIHVHNTFPLLSPSLYWAADDLGIPVVQTLHNFRLLCPQAIFLRNGSICMDCLGKAPWRGAVRGCYRESRAQSTVLATMLGVHRALGTWNDKVTRYIVLNEFCRQTFIRGGLPEERLAIKPNFVEDIGTPEEGERSGFLFVGRLSEEKGIQVLLAASRLGDIGRTTVAGTGPLANDVGRESNVSPIGAISPHDVRLHMGTVEALVVPSVCLESFPRTIVEAYASALPVVASRLGSLEEIVEDGVTGLLFEPGNARDLASKLEWARHHPAELRRMGANARARYEQRYMPGANYDMLMQIYGEAIRTHDVRAARSR